MTEVSKWTLPGMSWLVIVTSAVYRLYLIIEGCLQSDKSGLNGSALSMGSQSLTPSLPQTAP